MSKFSSEAHMHCEFFAQREKIFSVNEYFRGYEIFGKNYEGIEYPCEGGHIDFFLEHKSKLLIVEFKYNTTQPAGVLCQIYLYFMKLKKEFKDKKISIVVIYGDSPSKSDINELKWAMLAKGRKIKYIKREENLEFKKQIEKEYRGYKLEKEDDFFLLKHENELLVACESSGFNGFGKISWLVGKKIEEDPKYEVSGVIFGKKNKNGKENKNEKRLKQAIDEFNDNKDTIANIDVEFMIWHKDTMKFESILKKHKSRQ